MAHAATALAERYRDLGFRVIEGGKSGKIAILRTPALAEIYRVEHQNVLRYIRRYQEKLASNLRQGFAEHCRLTKYRARDGKDQPCFELTKVGFNSVAPNFDPSLGYLLALAFDALEHDDAAAGETVVHQINARIRELRSRASGQDELVFDASTDSAADDDEDDTKAREQWRLEGREFIPDRAPNAFQRDTWIDRHEGVAYRVAIRRDSKGNPLIWRIALDWEPSQFTPTPAQLRIPNADGTSQIMACVSPTVPLEVVERNFSRLPHGKFSPIALATLRHFLAK